MIGGLERLARLDVAWFRAINDGWYWRPLADLTNGLARDGVLVALLLAAGVVYLWHAGWRRAIVLGLWNSLAILAANVLHNQFLKPFFNRPRPFLTLADVHMSAPLGDWATLSSSFPSTHSAAAAAVAVVSSSLDPRLRLLAIVFMLGVALGTIYSGGHYPLDALAGLAVGSGLGWLINQIRRSLGSARGSAKRRIQT